MDESDIAQSIFPFTWVVHFSPTLLYSIHEDSGSGIIPSIFDTALNYELEGDKDAARLFYKSIIENYPISHEAKAAASRLVCIADSDAELQIAKDFLEGIYQLYPSSKLANAAYLDETMCKILLHDYASAISSYYQKLDSCTTNIDSVFTQLEIIYTYLKNDANQQKLNISDVICMGVSITNSKQAKIIAEYLLNIALSNKSHEPTLYHVPDIITAMNNYPNPFNPTTTISFSTPQTANCELVVYNVKGQAVKHLINGSKDRGVYKAVWNSDDDNGKKVSAGVYFYRLNINGHSTTKKMVFMK